MRNCKAPVLICADERAFIGHAKTPAEVAGNMVWSANPKAQAVTFTGALGKVTDNYVKPMKKKVNE